MIRAGLIKVIELLGLIYLEEENYCWGGKGVLRGIYRIISQRDTHGIDLKQNQTTPAEHFNLCKPVILFAMHHIR